MQALSPADCADLTALSRSASFLSRSAAGWAAAKVTNERNSIDNLVMDAPWRKSYDLLVYEGAAVLQVQNTSMMPPPTFLSWHFAKPSFPPARCRIAGT